ncbi:MAG: translocation/assembly module TamB domain-containing protein, partial [Caulobacteraceae bacterium]
MAGPAPPRRLAPAARWVGIAVLILVVAAAGLAVGVRYGPMTAAGRQFIESRVSGLKVGRLGTLRIEGLDGDVWRRFTLRRLSIADREGVWLDARGLSVAWAPGALPRRRLHILSLAANSVTLARRPVLTTPTPPAPPPVSIDIDRAATRVETAPALSGRRGAYEVRTALSVERAGGARGWVTAASALHLGDFLRAKFDVRRGGTFVVDADAREAQGGALAGMAGLAADRPFRLAAHARG